MFNVQNKGLTIKLPVAPVLMTFFLWHELSSQNNKIGEAGPSPRNMLGTKLITQSRNCALPSRHDGD